MLLDKSQIAKPVLKTEVVKVTLGTGQDHEVLVTAVPPMELLKINALTSVAATPDNSEAVEQQETDPDAIDYEALADQSRKMYALLEMTVVDGKHESLWTAEDWRTHASNGFTNEIELLIDASMRVNRAFFPDIQKN